MPKINYQVRCIECQKYFDIRDDDAIVTSFAAYCCSRQCALKVYHSIGDVLMS